MTELLVSFFIKDKEQVTNPKVRQAYGTMAGIVGIVCNLLLFLLKFFTGLLSGAVSVMADAFNNLSDAGSSIVTLIGFRMSGRPADPDHPFGHGRIEYLSGLFVAVAILLMGIELLQTAVDKILHPETPVFTMVSLAILVVSILVKFWMSRFNRVLGERISSEAMKATAADSLSDCVSTGMVLAGAVFTYVTNKNIDGFIGLFVAAFVLWAGANAAKETLQPLLGQAPDPEFVEGIRREVEKEELVLGIHDMIVHDYGPGRRMVSLHAEVPYNEEILKIHDVIDNIEFRIRKEFQCEITIHMDPVVTDDEEVKEAKEMAEAIVREMDASWNLHDFRMVKGETHTNLIFDVAVPAEHLPRAAEIAGEIREKIHGKNSHYFAVIQVEQSYV